jgi:nicotinate-nucleotide pyrophosphorylase (carboxylating)
MKIEVEVESEDDLREAVGGGADIVLIDNQSADTVRRWVEISRRSTRAPQIEASGNMTLERVRDYALAGVDSISVGALTHSVAAADVSLEVQVG